MGWYTGQIAIFAFDVAPAGWSRCDGSRLTIADNTLLHSRVGDGYGDKNKLTFALPMLAPLTPSGPFYCICIAGTGDTPAGLAEAFTGQVEFFPNNAAPQKWAPCDGKLMNLMEHIELFSVLGTRYGGDEVYAKTFGLPKLPPLTPQGPFPYICLEGVFPQN